MNVEPASADGDRTLIRQRIYVLGGTLSDPIRVSDSFARRGFTFFSFCRIDVGPPYLTVAPTLIRHRIMCWAGPSGTLSVSVTALFGVGSRFSQFIGLRVSLVNNYIPVRPLLNSWELLSNPTPYWPFAPRGDLKQIDFLLVKLIRVKSMSISQFIPRSN